MKASCKEPCAVTITFSHRARQISVLRAVDLIFAMWPLTPRFLERKFIYILESSSHVPSLYSSTFHYFWAIIIPPNLCCGVICLFQIWSARKRWLKCLTLPLRAAYKYSATSHASCPDGVLVLPDFHGLVKSMGGIGFRLVPLDSPMFVVSVTVSFLQGM